MPRNLYARANTGSLCACAQFRLERPFTRDRQHQARHARERVDRVLEPLLPDQASRRHTQRDLIADAQFRAPSGSHRWIRMKPRGVHTVWHGLDSIGAGPQCECAPGEIVAARSHKTRVRERASCGNPGGSEPFRDEHIRAVQADDERQPRGRDRGRDPARNDPVSVHDRRAMPSGDLARRAPACRQRQRRRHVGGGPQADVRPHGGCISEYVQRRQGSVPVEMKLHSLFFGLPRHQRMPRGDEVHLVAARGH